MIVTDLGSTNEREGVRTAEEGDHGVGVGRSGTKLHSTPKCVNRQHHHPRFIIVVVLQGRGFESASVFFYN